MNFWEDSLNLVTVREKENFFKFSEKSLTKTNINERIGKKMSNRINYIAIALTTQCNCNCFYCKETGESILPNIKGTWDFNHLKKAISIAYDVGLTTFRITGGEPTMVEYLPELIIYIMKLGDDTKIRLNTNGYNIDRIMDILEMYKERISVMISVDSLNEYVNGMHYPKYLSSKIENLTKELVKRKIPTRFNIVVTKSNYAEVKPLINKALSLGVNIKILDLIVRNEYFGNNQKIHNDEAVNFGKSIYQELNEIKHYLETISTDIQEKHYVSNANGIPMSGYYFGTQWVQVKDSSKGAMYAKECKHCPHYSTCYEGVFSPLLSVGEILHISGCMNSKLYYNLQGKSEEEIRYAFEEVLRIFESIELNSIK